jgi:hypothetical protein
MSVGVVSRASARVDGHDGGRIERLGDVKCGHPCALTGWLGLPEVELPPSPKAAARVSKVSCAN